MSVIKNIKFYNLQPIPCILDIQKPSTVYDLFKSAFPKADYYSFSFEGNEYSFDIIDYSSEFMFATCAKKDEIRLTNFMQQRDLSTKEASPYTSLGKGKQLESYTYFYIDFIKQKMAAISHKKISKIHIMISEFIYSESGNMAQINLAPEIIKDLKEEASKMYKKTYIELDFSNSIDKNNIRPITESLNNDFQFNKYSIKMKISKEGTGLIDKLINYKKENKELNGLKLYGKNDDGLDEIINFFESIYMRPVPFELSDNIATNTELIKKILKETLIKHLSTFY